jgi:hypothetical protein
VQSVCAICMVDYSLFLNRCARRTSIHVLCNRLLIGVE